MPEREGRWMPEREGRWMPELLRAEQVYYQLTQADCPHPWDEQPHLKSACRRCTIEAYDAALRAVQQETVEMCAKVADEHHHGSNTTRFCKQDGTCHEYIATTLRATVGGKETP